MNKNSSKNSIKVSTCNLNQQNISPAQKIIMTRTMRVSNEKVSKFESNVLLSHQNNKDESGQEESKSISASPQISKPAYLNVQHNF